MRIATKSKANARGPKEQGYAPALVMPLVAFALVCVCAVVAKGLVKLRSASKEAAQEQASGTPEKGQPVYDDNDVEWDTAGEEFWDADEKKPQQEDDNVSTATPVSLPDSLPSLDQNAADRV
jgi:hypothetical protein